MSTRNAHAANDHLEMTIEVCARRIAMFEGEVATLRADNDALRRTLLGEAELADAQSEPEEARGPGWWRACWREVSRERSELRVRVKSLEDWLLESGKEATQLQRDLDAARQVIGNLERQLDLARTGAPVEADDQDDWDADTVIEDEEIH